MKTTMRIGLVGMAAAFMMACGGASSDPLEQVSGGASRLDGKEAAGDPTKIPSDCTDPKPTDPNDPKDPGTCFSVYEGGTSSCKSSSDWKVYADSLCTAKKATLTALSFGTDCGKDSYIEVKFECCSASVPPTDPEEPPKDPSSCFGEYLDGVCQSEADWKNTAAQVCAKGGLNLTDIGYGSVCGKNGEIGEVKFTCCK